MLSKEDGRTGAMGVASSLPRLNDIVMDLGGRSTQLSQLFKQCESGGTVKPATWCRQHATRCCSIFATIAGGRKEFLQEFAKRLGGFTLDRSDGDCRQEHNGLPDFPTWIDQHNKGGISLSAVRKSQEAAKSPQYTSRYALRSHR